MTYEFRELFEVLSRESGASFKVGLLFSKEKTRQERLRREDVALRELNRYTRYPHAPAFDEVCGGYRPDLDLIETLLPSTDFLSPCPVYFTDRPMKPGASLSASRSFSTVGISRYRDGQLVTKQTDPWVRSHRTSALP